MSNNIVETLIGAVVLAAAVGFFYFTYSRVEVGSIDGYELVAKFESVDGLGVGSDVRLSGIKIGTVTDQSLDRESYLAIVRFSIDPNIQLPTDSSAKIASEGLLGGNYLSLSPGGMDEYLLDGDEVEFTQGSVDLFDLIGKAIYSVNNDEPSDN
jgi:phospholipid/cholesterol/gamma-HCH transport system substrate-binding protein